MNKIRIWLAYLVLPKGFWVAPDEMTDSMWQARRHEYREGRTYNDGWRAMRDNFKRINHKRLFNVWL